MKAFLGAIRVRIRRRALVAFPVELTALAAALSAVVGVFGFLSASTGWRDDEWGSDGWPFKSGATLVATLACTAAAVGLQLPLTRWRPSWLLATASLAAGLLGAALALAQFSGIVIPLLLLGLAAAVVAL